MGIQVKRRHPAAWIVALLVVVRAGGAAGQGLSVVEAAQAALAEQPNVLLALERLDASRGDLRAVEGIFDLQVTSGFNQVRSVTANTSFEQQFQQMPRSSAANLSTLTGGLTKLLRGGQVIAPSIELRRTDVGSLPPVENRASLSLFLSQPLLRGRGREIAYAPVVASRIEVEANTLDVRYLKSASVFSTTISYWNYVAAVRRLEIFRTSEVRAREIFDQTQVLIQAGNRPAADLKQVQANLASRVSQRLSGEQSLYEARQALGVAIGLPYEKIDSIPLPSDPFPEVPAVVPALDPMVGLAAQNRPDLQSSRRRIDSASTFLRVAQDNLRPKVDLIANLGYAGLDEGSNVFRYLTPFGNRVTGPQATVGMAWDFSPPNNQAIGRLTRSQSQLSQARIEAAELERSLKSNVAVALDNVRRSADRLASVREAVQLYMSAVEDQRQMQQLGVTTIIDLINTEDRLTASQIDELTATLNLSIAITQLRFETGTLLTPDDQVDRTTLTTPPTAQ